MKTIRNLLVLSLFASLAGCVAYVPADVHREGPGHHGMERHRDQDRDGIPDRRDRDRDGDSVPNRYDSRPDNPYRR